LLIQRRLHGRANLLRGVGKGSSGYAQNKKENTHRYLSFAGKPFYIGQRHDGDMRHRVQDLIADRGVHQIFFRDPDGHLIEIGNYGVLDR